MYKPTKKELEQIANLNEAYRLIKEGMRLIKNNLVKKDSEVEMQAYKMNKNFDKIIKRIKRILEKQYIDKEFMDIIEHSMTKPKAKPKANRLKKKPKKDVKKKTTKKVIRKKKKGK